MWKFSTIINMKKNNQNNVALKIITGLWLIITSAFFYISSIPQCPDNYTQAEIDSSNCIIGAHIGAGILLLGVIITTIVVAILWIALALKKRTK